MLLSLDLFDLLVDFIPLLDCSHNVAGRDARGLNRRNPGCSGDEHDFKLSLMVLQNATGGAFFEVFSHLLRLG
jgi:hypothetical protein